MSGGLDRGSATAEMAMALPALMVMLVAGVTLVAAVADKLACEARARDAALAAARGEHLPATGGVRLEFGDGRVTAIVTTAVNTCDSVAAREQ